MRVLALLGALFLLAGAVLAAPRVVEQAGYVVLAGDTYVLKLDLETGAITSFAGPGDSNPLCWSGPDGLWKLAFADHSELVASQFGASGTRTCKVRILQQPPRVELHYSAPEAEVEVTLTPRPGWVDFTGRVQPYKQAALTFALPARLYFSTETLTHFYSPLNGTRSVGAVFAPGFFKPQPPDSPSGWRPEPLGPAGYEALFGGPLLQKADFVKPITLQVTSVGRKALSPALCAALEHSQAEVNRPSAPGQLDVVWVDSSQGPWFGASHLHGKGLLWRVGGKVGPEQAPLLLQLVRAALDQLPGLPARKGKIALVDLVKGPQKGGWCEVELSDWARLLSDWCSTQPSRFTFVKLTTPDQVLQALKGDEYAAILNPYGENVPIPEKVAPSAFFEALRNYVQRGGWWFECGGYPFYYALRPVKDYYWRSSYPAAFADFFHFDTTAGSVSLYRVQPRTWQSWSAAKDPSKCFVPGELGFGGSEEGGYCWRDYATYVKPGTWWQAPTSRLAQGLTARTALQAYAEANALQRPLSAKVPPALLAKLKRAVLVYYGGTAREKIAGLPYLPRGCLLHFADYLKGGFDKEYPDHLPPNRYFGTAEDLKQFFEAAHTAGDLISPYTNPTWWCDNPRGPTFQQAGEAPLLRTLDGKLSPERYAQNTGFSICFWHPAVQAANRRTRAQFTEEFPVDVLFEDQCGARGWRYDTNPASPTPYAYTEGLLSLVQEDSEHVPLATENGWDQVAKYETYLCGMSWGLVPTTDAPFGRNFLKDQYPPKYWKIFPAAEYLAHTDCLFLHHDLGQFVTNEQVLAWSLGLGYCLSYRMNATTDAESPELAWLKWLAVLQQTVCARYAGQLLLEFKHLRGPDADEGSLFARYGQVEISANLCPTPRTVAGRRLASYGFFASAPGLRAGCLSEVADRDFGAKGAAFVAEKIAERRYELNWYASEQALVGAVLPETFTGSARLAWADGKHVQIQVRNGEFSTTTPYWLGRHKIAPPTELAPLAPSEWPGKPAIAVLDMPGLSGSWVKVSPAEWLEALRASTELQQANAKIVPLTSPEALQAALKAGATRYFAIVNPYGELLPTTGPGQAKATLAAIRDYVQHGGTWWETGGLSFCQAIYPAGKTWQREALGEEGLQFFGLSAGTGPVEQLPEPLAVTPLGKQVLGPALSKLVETSTTQVNRELPTNWHDPGHVTLVVGQSGDFAGGYRLGGWGWLWRLGGLNPSPALAKAVVVRTLEVLYTHPPLPVMPSVHKRVWQAELLVD